jgi:hypothetical protein
MSKKLLAQEDMCKVRLLQPGEGEFINYSRGGNRRWHPEECCIREDGRCPNMVL